MSQIAVGDLTYYLERNGFYPRREDIEAILRRLDHNADQALSYVDFCELTTITDPHATGQSPQKDSQQTFQSPTKTVNKNVVAAADQKPVATFNVDNKETLKPAKASTTPVKSQVRIDAEKAANDERLKVEAIIAKERLE